jgi:hypothetical protein
VKKEHHVLACMMHALRNPFGEVPSQQSVRAANTFQCVQHSFIFSCSTTHHQPPTFIACRQRVLGGWAAGTPLVPIAIIIQATCRQLQHTLGGCVPYLTGAATSGFVACAVLHA